MSDEEITQIGTEEQVLEMHGFEVRHVVLSEDERGVVHSFQAYWTLFGGFEGEGGDSLEMVEEELVEFCDES